MNQIKNATIVKGAPVEIDTEILPTVSGSYIRSLVIQNDIEASSIPKEGRYLEMHEATVQTNHFLLMLELAFNKHKNVTISPDDLWLLICQGVAEHIKLYEEEFKSLITNFNGKQTIEVQRNDFVLGGDNPWEEVFPEFTRQISQKMEGDLYATMALQFSTSTIRETTAFEIAFMDAMSNYFDYEFISLCGIPEIHIKGTVEDYKKILASLYTLKGYQLDWWVDQLCPIIETIIETLQGKDHTSFWTSIYKHDNKSGGPYVTGWITKFFPYIGRNILEKDTPLNTGNIKAITNKDIEDFLGVNNTESIEYEILKKIKEDSEEKRTLGFVKAIIKNPVFDSNSNIDLKLDEFPKGVSNVPFKWKYFDQELDMHFMSGFMGIKEDISTHTLSTDIHWGITK